jgi:hypothetical protein
MRPRGRCENPAFNTRGSMGVSQSGSRAGDEFEPAATDRNPAAVGQPSPPRRVDWWRSSAMVELTAGARRQAAVHESITPSFRPICACHMDSPLIASTRHVDAPWIAADLAVLNEAAVNVRLDVDLHLLAAKRTRDQKLV